MSVLGLTVQYRVGGEAGPDSLRRLSVAFERAGAELVQLDKHVFPLLQPVFEAAEQRQFDAEGSGPDVGEWAPLSEAYAERKRQKYPAARILERTGALRDGMTRTGSAYARREATNNTFLFGTQGVPYASFHQTGTARMPVRAVFDFDAEFERELEAAARRGMVAALKTARLDQVAKVTEAP